MTITQLHYVLAVAEHQNFTRAAEHCFVTQPTLNKNLALLSYWYRIFRPFRHRAATGGTGALNDKGCFACVLELEGVLNHFPFHHFTRHFTHSHVIGQAGNLRPTGI